MYCPCFQSLKCLLGGFFSPLLQRAGAGWICCWWWVRESMSAASPGDSWLTDGQEVASCSPDYLPSSRSPWWWTCRMWFCICKPGFKYLLRHSTNNSFCCEMPGSPSRTVPELLPDGTLLCWGSQALLKYCFWQHQQLLAARRRQHLAALTRSEVQVLLLFGNLVVIQPTSFSTGRVATSLGVIKRSIVCPMAREPELIQAGPQLGTDGLKRVWSPTWPCSSHLPLHSTAQLWSDLADK